MDQKAEALWNGDSVLVRAGPSEDTMTFFCTGVGFDRSLAEHACESLARAVVACLCAALIKRLSQRGLSPDELRVQACVCFDESSTAIDLASVKVDVTAVGSSISEVVFQEVIEQSRQHCPVCRLLEQRVSIQARIEPESALEGTLPETKIEND